MRPSDHCGKGHFRHTGDKRLDFRRIDPLSPGFDQILGPPRDENLSLLAQDSKVACFKPAIFRCVLSLSEIARHHRRSSYPEMTFPATLFGQRLPIMVGQHQIKPDRRPTRGLR